MTLSFRGATDADLDRLLEIHVSAFPDPRRMEARRRNFSHNPLGSLADLVVAEREGAIVAHAFVFPLESWFGGVRVRLGGVASLGVAPESRGVGIGRALLSELEARALARGDAITLLYPFREGFYVRAGYASVASFRRFLVAPRAIPRSWGHGQGAAGRIRPASGDDREGLVRAYEQEALHRTGWIARPAALWEKILVNERRRWFVLEHHGRVDGYVAWTLEQDEPHAAVGLVVEELVGGDDARMRLLGLAAAQRDEVREIQLDLADDDPIQRAFVDVDRDRWGDARGAHALGTILAGPMVRILDVRSAIEARGYLEDGDLELVVDAKPADPLRGSKRAGPRERTARRAAAPPRPNGLGLRSLWFPPAERGRETRLDRR